MTRKALWSNAILRRIHHSDYSLLSNIQRQGGRASLLKLYIAPNPKQCLSRLETGKSIPGEVGSPNGNRTRISALRGLRPQPLDDRAGAAPQGFEPR